MTATLLRRAEENIGGGGGALTSNFRRRRGKIFSGGATGLDLYIEALSAAALPRLYLQGRSRRLYQDLIDYSATPQLQLSAIVHAIF
jgi:hypothetical protein